MTKREIARVRALLLSSGIKAKEISRRAAEPKDLRTDQESPYQDIAELAREKIALVPKSQEHRLAAKILSDDIQLSAQMWHTSADEFCNATVTSLVERISILQSRLVTNLTPLARGAADEADEVSKDLVTSQTLKVKRITDKIDKMMRKRRRRFRWLRRGGWVLVEWLLVGVMWYVWFMVVLTRIVMGVGKGVVRSLRWLFWLD
jgi:Fe2+ transport system protein B